MGKKARIKNKEKRDAQKRARREANKRRWQEMARAGENIKTKRYLSKRKRKVSLETANINHPDGACGNLACNRCYPSYPPYS